jgi:predicted metal-dependent RNase
MCHKFSFIALLILIECYLPLAIYKSEMLPEAALLSAIALVVQAGGNVLLPAFALGRAQ